MTELLCSVDGCERPVKARGWCSTHYSRWRFHGDPTVNLNPPHVVRHGTVNEYNNYGCRCDPCRAASAAYYKVVAKVPCANNCGRLVYGRFRPGAFCRSCYALAQTIPLEDRHGTETGYKKGCRCAECRAAEAKARRLRRQRMKADRPEEYAKWLASERARKARSRAQIVRTG